MKNHRFVVIDHGFMGNYVCVVPFATDPISAATKAIDGGFAEGASDLLVSTQDDNSEEVHAWIEWRVDLREDEHGFLIAKIAESSKRYMCRCDSCGIPLANAGGVEYFNSSDSATEAATKSGWTIDGFKTKCPSCPAVDADATARQRRMREGIVHQIAQSGGGDAPVADVATPLKKVYSDGSDVPFTIPYELHQELAKWGRDHWSTFAYLETRIVDHGGSPDHLHMRCNPKLHPHYGCGRHPMNREYVTRTASGTIQDHDDWSCIEDAERLGLLSNVGTGIEPAYRFTDVGHRIALMLRRHLQQGRHASEFRM